jgi:hypothetical protein
MDDRLRGVAAARQPYVKPEVARVDMFEDEVALATCKAGTNGPVNSSGVSGPNKKCKSTCKDIAAS